MARMMNTFATALVQYEHRTLEEDDFARYVGTFKGFLESPGGKVWLANVGRSFMTGESLAVLGSANEISLTSKGGSSAEGGAAS